MAQMRAFHTHDLAKIIQVVHSTVHNAVVLPAVVLAVHGGGQIITTFGGVKAAHLNGQMDPAADFAQCWRKVFGRGQCVGKIVAVKIRPALGRIPVPADAGRRSAQFQRTVPGAWPALFAD